jgi:GT2 family glycosyltransferase
VSYGDRFKLLEQTLNFCEESKEIQKIAIVDNNSSSATKLGIKRFSAASKKECRLYSLEKNYGSALGFKKAIEEGLKTSAEFIFILDDDNLPDNNCLKEMLAFWKVNDENLNDIILANRVDRNNFKKAIEKRDPSKVLQPKNHYLGFHWSILINKLKERLKSPQIENSITAKPLAVEAGPYSGMLFHRSIIDKIGLPNEDFVLYMDDFEFSMRLKTTGGKIWLVPSAIIEDIEQSVYLPKKKGLLYHSAIDGEANQMYYSFRNMHYFGRNFLIDNVFSYFVNKIAFWLIFGLMALLRGNPSKIKLLRSAVQDAENGKLGMNANYQLK